MQDQDGLSPNGTGRINDLSSRLGATEKRLDTKLENQDKVLAEITKNVTTLTVDVAVIKDRLFNDEKDADHAREDRHNGWEVKAIIIAAALASVSGIVTSLWHLH